MKQSLDTAPASRQLLRNPGCWEFLFGALLQEALQIHQLRRFSWQEGVLPCQQDCRWREAHGSIRPLPSSVCSPSCVFWWRGWVFREGDMRPANKVAAASGGICPAGVDTRPFYIPCAGWEFCTEGLVAVGFPHQRKSQGGGGTEARVIPASAVISPSVPGQGWVPFGALMNLFAHEGSPLA